MKKTILVLIILYTFLLFGQVNLTQAQKERSNYIIGTNQNLLKNPGFEENGTDWNYNSKVYSIDNSIYHSGNRSLKFQNNNPDNYQICSQNFQLVPGRNYYFSAYIKTKNIEGTDFGASIAIEWFDKDGKWLSGSYPIGVKGTSDWYLVESNTFIPENASTAHLICYVRKGMTGEAWFDDVVVKRILNPKIEAYFKTPLYRGQINSQDILNFTLNTKLIDYDNNTNKLKIKASLLNSETGKIYQIKTSYLNKNNLSESNFSSNNLPQGKYKIKIDLITPNNTTIDTTGLDITIRKSQPNNKVYFDKYLRTIVNGKPFFPLGMYIGDINKDDLEMFSQSKFNCIMPYTSPSPEQMDLAEKFGLKVIYSLKDFYFGTQYCPKEIESANDEEKYIKNIVSKVKNKNALLAWYLADEPKTDFISRIQEHKNWVMQEDENHPIWIVLDKVNDIALYRNIFDVVGSDPYPIGTEKNISLAGEWTKTTFEQVDSSKPVWMVPQVHNLSVYFKDKKNLTPTFQEIKNMAWQCITQGAKGLIFYSFFDLKRNPNVKFDESWEDVKKVAADLSNYSDILLSIEDLPNVKIENQPGWIDYLVKQQGNKTYIFAVNNGNGNGEIIFLFKKIIKSIKINGKTLDVSNEHQINDVFDKLDVKIYEIVLE